MEEPQTATSRPKAYVRRTHVVSKKSRFNLSIHTRRAVVNVPPKMAKVTFWLSVMNPARKETIFRV